MTARPRLFIGMLAACGVLLAGQALVSFSPLSPPNDSCARLRAWATSYSGASPTLNTLATYDRAHRLAIFGAVTPEVRSSLWREHLRLFAQRADLSPEQRSLIRRASALATPALYAAEPKAQAAYGHFWPMAAIAFTTPEHKRLWYDLGAVLPNPSQAATRVPFCECNQAQPSYGCSGTCAGSPCNRWGPGCGAIGASVCDGICQ